ncbi:MAG TPA: thiamine pyrophosphate-dependent dehydrogenase E1 component subunit alpha [Alphaproteobacteria bacterium]
MARIRAFEEAAEAAVGAGLVKGVVHLSIGQEAVAAGVCLNLTRTDLITSTHRGHGHTLAKGADPRSMMCELFGRASGVCGGRGGSMHIADFGIGMLGANGVVAAGIPIAVGAAHAVKLSGGGRIVVCFFGDGAINRGPFLEGLNWAKAYGLPVLFVCEDNQYSATTCTAQVSAGAGPLARARAIGLDGLEVDGNDVVAVDRAAGELIRRIRAGEGPMLLHAMTYRIKGHTSSDPGTYRSPDELAAQIARDPLQRAARTLAELGIEPDTIQSIERAAKDEIDAAYAAAAAAPWPAAMDAFSDVQDVGAGQWR